MDSLTITVSDEALAAEVEGWQDGAEYTLRVRQDSPGQFTAISAEESAAEEAEPDEENEGSGASDMSHIGGKGMMHGKMPAVAIVIAKGRGK